MKILLFLLFITTGFAQVTPHRIGHYTDGKLLHAQELPFEGDGFMRQYLELNEGWGTTELIQMITKAVAFMGQRYPQKERLQIESLSKQEGGKIDSHSSHQNGLDVDMAYFRNERRNMIPSQWE